MRYLESADMTARYMTLQTLCPLEEKETPYGIKETTMWAAKQGVRHAVQDFTHAM
jgi:hypothetical protein